MAQEDYEFTCYEIEFEFMASMNPFSNKMIETKLAESSQKVCLSAMRYFPYDRWERTSLVGESPVK